MRKVISIHDKKYSPSYNIYLRLKGKLSFMHFEKYFLYSAFSGQELLFTLKKILNIHKI